MRHYLLIFVIMTFQQAIQAQPLLKVKEVFDFNIGDSFQIAGSASIGQTPNADRIDIIDKYYSAAHDTLYYVRYHHSYYSMIEWEGGPHLVYTYYTDTDTVWYTNLGADISAYDSNFFFSNLYNGPEAEFCDSIINGYRVIVGPGWENEIHTVKYGKGLGLVYYEVYNEVTLGYPRLDKMTYYKKGDNYCGTPDLTVAGKVNTDLHVNVFPNPASDILNYYNSHTNTFFRYDIIDSFGRILGCGKCGDDLNRIDISALKKGVYFLRLYNEQDFTVTRFIK